MSRLAAAATLCLCLCVCGAAKSSASPLDDVLAAVAAEQAAPSVRAVLKLEKENAVNVYVVERVKPDRLRIVLNPDQSAGEIVLIGATTYWRGPAGWKRIPSARAPAVVPSVTGLFSTGLTDFTEQTASASRRNFTGHMAWSNGGEPNLGQLTIAVNIASNLPEQLVFDGTCAGKPCRFSQSFSYDAALVIDVPK